MLKDPRLFLQHPDSHVALCNNDPRGIPLISSSIIERLLGFYFFHQIFLHSKFVTFLKNSYLVAILRF